MPTRVEDIPPELIVDFDINDPRLADTMQARAEQLRGIGRVVYTPMNGGHWIATHYKDVGDVLRDYRTFSNSPSTNIVGLGEKQIPNEIDPPEHSAYRQLLNPLFSPRRMEEIEPEIRRQIGTLLDAFAPRGSCEFVSEFAHELPARVFLSLMGWALADAPMLSQWTTDSLLGVPGGTAEESAKVRRNAADHIFDYFRQTIARCRGSDLDNYSMELMTTPVNGQVLPEDRLLQMFFLLLMAGLHTVQGALSYGMIYLVRDREMFAGVHEDRASVPTMVEEILRIEGQVSPARNVTCETTLGGQQLLPGDRIMLMFCAANRDAAEFGEPQRFDPNRMPNRHLSFAAGPHRCIGSHLARLEMTLAFNAILDRMADLRLDPERPPTFHASQVRGVMSLDLLFTPER